MFCYAVGWTHHTTGVQIIRACSIMQGLLGNIGRPGGGIHGAARALQHPGQHRHSDAVQHAADLPAAARRVQEARTFDDYLAEETPATGWWHNFPKYAVSLLKAWYGPKRARTMAGATISCPN